MAQYTPRGWVASAAASKQFQETYPVIRKLVQSRARRYFNLASIDKEDLVQDGLTAALYAIDSFKPELGKKLAAYMGRLIDNAMMMIVAESRSQCRQPYTWVPDDAVTTEPAKVKHTILKAKKPKKPSPNVKFVQAPSAAADRVADAFIDTILKPKPKANPNQGWRRIPVFEGVEPDMVEASTLLSITEVRENALERQDRIYSEQLSIKEFRGTLSAVGALMFDLRQQPPAELLIVARNLVGRNVTDRARMPNQAIAAYLGLELSVVVRALKELRGALDRRYQQRGAVRGGA